MYTGDGPVPQTGMKHINLDKIHPTKQLDAIYKIIDKGEDVSITINSVMAFFDINNLITLGNHPEKSIQCGYKGYYLNPNDVKIYEYNMKNKKWVKVKPDEIGYKIDWYIELMDIIMAKSTLCRDLRDSEKNGEDTYVN